VATAVAEANVGGPGRGREATFDLRATREVTITDFSVTTRDDLTGRSFADPADPDSDIIVVLEFSDGSTGAPALA